jgi:FKBP-type peptidyl-prolyl cis-trans isomerase
MKFKFLSFLLLITTSIIAVSCFNNNIPVTNDNTLAQYVADTTAIGDTLRHHNVNYTKHASGVYMVVYQLGNGMPAKASNYVDVTYIGRLFKDSAAVFDQGNIDLPLNGLIPGWQIALTYLPAGTKAAVVIPSYYGYGAAGQGSIPGNSILTFNLTFDKVDFTAAEKKAFTSDTTAIDKFVRDTANHVSAVKDSLGLYYKITQTGTGDSATWFSKVKLHYTIRTLASPSTVVKEYTFEPVIGTFDSRVADYIDAIKIALLKMNKGSKATLYVPAGLGYGTRPLIDSDNSTQLLPANSKFIIDLELLDILD